MSGSSGIVSRSNRSLFLPGIYIPEELGGQFHCQCYLNRTLHHLLEIVGSDFGYGTQIVPSCPPRPGIFSKWKTEGKYIVSCRICPVRFACSRMAALKSSTVQETTAPR